MENMFGFVSFLKAYQLSWVFWCPSNPFKRTVVILFNPQLDGIKGFILFPKAITPKVNAILWLGFELAYYDVPVHCISHYAQENMLKSFGPIDLQQIFFLCQTVILFTNPSAWAGYNTRSIFKRSLTGLNSEFSFS